MNAHQINDNSPKQETAVIKSTGMITCLLKVSSILWTPIPNPWKADEKVRQPDILNSSENAGESSVAMNSTENADETMSESTIVDESENVEE